jgi:peptidoglycan hydrolase-like protein with peptidoglycan-binding domain
MMRRYALLVAVLLGASALLQAHVGSLAVAHAAASAVNSQTARTPSAAFIKSLQRELRRAGYHPGATDGKMGPATRQALRQFQEAHSLPPSGDLDIPTLTKLLEQGLPR